MQTETVSPILAEKSAPSWTDSLLEQGDRLSRDEFPGLWLDTAALLRGDLKTVLAVVRRGVESPEHSAFLSQ